MKRISFLIKPASSLCNMRCRYCFYADVAEHREVANFGIMTDDVAHALIDRALALSDDADITFAFQGGEPTCAGLAFFERFCAYVDDHATAQTIHYALQTNGYVVDDVWADFFRRSCKRLNIAYYREDYCGYRDFLEDAAPAMQRIARSLARR